MLEGSSLVLAGESSPVSAGGPSVCRWKLLPCDTIEPLLSCSEGLWSPLELGPVIGVHLELFWGLPSSCMGSSSLVAFSRLAPL